jgi:hypothetical protein
MIMSTLQLFTLFGIAMAMILYSMRLFDKLLEAEYQHWRNSWEADGQPNGFFWSPPVTNQLKSDFAKKYLILKWIVVTPPWIVPGSREARLHLQFRVVTGLTNITFLGIIVRVLMFNKRWL